MTALPCPIYHERAASTLTASKAVRDRASVLLAEGVKPAALDADPIFRKLMADMDAATAADCGCLVYRGIRVCVSSNGNISLYVKSKTSTRFCQLYVNEILISEGVSIQDTVDGAWLDIAGFVLRPDPSLVSVDGIPWELHAICDSRARAVAVAAYRTA